MLKCCTKYAVVNRRNITSTLHTNRVNIHKYWHKITTFTNDHAVAQ